MLQAESLDPDDGWATTVAAVVDADDGDRSEGSDGGGGDGGGGFKRGLSNGGRPVHLRAGAKLDGTQLPPPRTCTSRSPSHCARTSRRYHSRTGRT